MAQSKTAPLVRYCGFTFLLFSALLWVATTICFLGTWDHVAAITVFPQWSWAVGGILTAAVAFRLLRSESRLPLFTMLLWLLSCFYFADNLLPVVRGVLHGAAPKGRAQNSTFRIVTLNCASSPLAAREVMKFQPDIVLLQELPPSNTVAHLARDWFGEAGSVVAGFDCAIVSHYPLKAIDARMATHHTRAILTLPQGRELLVTSLRLTPPLGRTDLWNPAAWRGYKEDRRQRRRELRSVLETEPRVDLPEILAGDFNAPMGDGIYKLLGQYRDSHRTAGRGWGNTALNDIPLFRLTRFG